MKTKMNIESLIESINHSYNIEKSQYDHYNVKRGLRNKNGSGVLVGLTRIGEVHGYIKDEQEVVPVEGKLFYRGIEVRKIIDALNKDNRFGFEEIAFLLIFGKLPNQDVLDHFDELLDKNRKLPLGFTENMILKTPSSNIMNKLARSILALYSHDNDPENINIENVARQSIELIARFPVLVAFGFQAKSHYFDNKSLFLHKPKNGLSTAENFLRLIRPDKKYTELEAKTLDICLILHAEHGGGNNSAFTTHVVTSSDTDTYSSIAAAVGSLKGPKHGGASIRVMQMMDDFRKHVADWTNEKQIADYIVKILKKEAFDRTGLVYGIGHAVYTISDPRAVVLKKYAQDLAKEKGREREFQLYDSIERLTPQLFKEVKNIDKKLCANVDFYSGFIYNMLGIPSDLYTPIFAMGRITGWCAHRLEELISSGRIIRPAYKSVEDRNEYIPLNSRK